MPARVLFIGFGLGTVLHLLLIVLSRGGARRLERLAAWLFTALFLWHGGNLFALTLASFHGLHTAAMVVTARAIAFTGLALVPPLLADVHYEHANWSAGRARWLIYLPLAAAPWGIRVAAEAPGIPRGLWTDLFIAYLAGAMALGVVVNVSAARRSDAATARFHRALAWILALLGGACVYAFVLAPAGGTTVSQQLLMLSSIAPSALVGYWMFRFNFLEPRRQRAAVFAVLAVAALAIYAAVIARIGHALEFHGFMPSVLAQGLLVFVLAMLVEPVADLMRAWLKRRLSHEFTAIDAVREQLLAEAIARPPAAFRESAATRISEFLGFPVGVNETGQLLPTAGRQLNARDSALLLVLSSQLGAALERSRLIADRLALERELAERQKLAELGEMTAFVAHRLKNPLSAISTLTQVIAEQAPGTLEHCRVVNGEIRRLNEAIRDLLRYTAPASASPAGRANAAEALQEAGTLFAAEAARRGLAIETACDPDIVLPIATGALHDILTSLIGNALDAAPPGSVVRVACRLHTAAEQVTLAVEDDGPGVPPDAAEKIFDPFVTLKPGGTGLGLALARRRATEAGAAIGCVSPLRDGRGARFEVLFPARPSREESELANAREK